MNMKKISIWFFKNPTTDKDTMDFALAFLRIFSGLMMLPYGWGKIERYETLKTSFFGDPIGIGHETSLIICIFQQIFCSIMLILGIQSRFAAFMLFTNMAVALKFHFFDPFCAVKALPTVFLGMYAFLVVSGGGRFTLDNLIFKNFEAGQGVSGNGYCALRIAFMAAAFLIFWLALANAFNLGGIVYAISFAIASFILLVSVYGFNLFKNIR